MKVLLSTVLLALATSLLPLSLCAQQKDTTSGECIVT
jgi:hypothetical protein